ncbi:MAG: OmpA family protein, partial [Gammaproteobacteria bacterium]
VMNKSVALIVIALLGLCPTYRALARSGNANTPAQAAGPSTGVSRSCTKADSAQPTGTSGDASAIQYVNAAELGTSPAALHRLWEKPKVVIGGLDWVDCIVRVGDVDNFGYGWPNGYSPFSGETTPPHDYPFEPSPTDPEGTDRIMVGSSYNGHPPDGTDGYTSSTSRPANKPRPIVIDLPADHPKTGKILLQLFVDDFQAPSFGSHFQMTLDGERMHAMEEVLNSLDETGPIGKLISLPLPPAYHRLLDDNRLVIFIDDPTTGAGDGYAIDFVRLLFNPRKFPYSGSISGRVTRADNGKPIAGALVSSALIQDRTAADGSYRLAGVPAGLAVVEAQKTGFQSASKITNLPTEKTPTVNLKLEAEKITRTSPLAATLAKSCTVAVYGIHFDFNKATLRPDSTPVLKQVLALLQGDPTLQLEIGGNTDNVGTKAYNLTLSDQRAKAVEDWLVTHGIAASRLTAQGYGETRPLVPNTSPQNRAKNRRVELKRKNCTDQT